jgi:uncharacterized membrane protein
MSVPYPVVASIASALLIIAAALVFFAQNQATPPVGKGFTYPMIGGWGALLFAARAAALGMHSDATILDLVAVCCLGVGCLAASCALFFIRKTR